jgi:hypothetical protein
MTLCLREMMPGRVVMRWGGKTWEFPDYGTSWRAQVHRIFPRILILPASTVPADDQRV